MVVRDHLDNLDRVVLPDRRVKTERMAPLVSRDPEVWQGVRGSLALSALQAWLGTTGPPVSRGLSALEALSAILVPPEMVVSKDLRALPVSREDQDLAATQDHRVLRVTEAIRASRGLKDRLVPLEMLARSEALDLPGHEVFRERMGPRA